MFEFARSLTVPSAARYFLWRVRGDGRPVTLRARSGERFELRPNGLGRGGNNDYGVAYEIFAHDLYGPAARLARDDVRLVVDCGANVGLSVLRWLTLFPRCSVIAFEPHDGHATQAARNIALNAAEGRVDLVRAGVGAADYAASLSDGGSGSTVQESGEGLSIRIVDIFPRLSGRRIDLLKLDCEGAEYAVLGDDRFAGLDVRAIVMEWHARPGGLGRSWCVERLRSLGYAVEELDDGAENGMLWAERSARPAMPAGGVTSVPAA